MCFNYRMGFDPEPSKNPGDEFLIIVTFDPSGRNLRGTRTRILSIESGI